MKREPGKQTRRRLKIDAYADDPGGISALLVKSCIYRSVTLLTYAP